MQMVMYEAPGINFLDNLFRGGSTKAVRSLVEKEVVKNYSPPAITAAVKEYAPVKIDFDISESVSYLMEHGYLVKNYRVPQRSTKGIDCICTSRATKEA
ncbi:hypothetical protein Glove_164g40 [Diversispora epigaea]|uniref:Uncharacterized protein n=1 Tax=Diversispora epigaea TaxID=1348612 RepID=A0A397IXE7_9GLOM|nr:hypothetical protein Glove_164g40 [Diversispora epigaea]